MTTTTTEETSAAYRDPLTCDECGCFQSKHDTTCSRWQEVTVEANVVTFNRPVGGWPTLAELIARSIALGGDPFAPQSDDVEYGSWCPFCGNRAAVCRCD
jgi:hypothetical protein